MRSRGTGFVCFDTGRDALLTFVPSRANVTVAKPADDASVLAPVVAYVEAAFTYPAARSTRPTAASTQPAAASIDTSAASSDRSETESSYSATPSPTTPVAALGNTFQTLSGRRVTRTLRARASEQDARQSGFVDL